MFCLFCLKLLLILNLTKHICIIGCCFVRQRNPMDLKTYTLAKKPATVTTWQMTKSIDVRQNYLCDCHLWSDCRKYSPWIGGVVGVAGGGVAQDVVVHLEPHLQTLSQLFIHETININQQSSRTDSSKKPKKV